ncbi:MAG: DNA translocase FtsK 4TM domain-containing protein [Desulfobulbaceae bacterium]|jgi:S-DNA-T family DNA segregation ATPase FtsK/SpoIIIE|nr:DNA translocase FtsK 4TM domain-containing protein [Desulfobulbaceae bacterium]
MSDSERRQEFREKPSLFQEFLTAAGLFCSFYVLVSLLSARFTDSDWCGRLGGIIADFLWGFCGWGSFLFVLLIAFASVSFLRRERTFARIPYISLGLSGALIAICGLLATFSPQGDEAKYGGFLGRLTYDLLARVTGIGGTILVLLLLILVSVMLCWRFSPYSVAIGAAERARSYVRARHEIEAKDDEAEPFLPIVKRPPPLFAEVVEAPVSQMSQTRKHFPEKSGQAAAAPQQQAHGEWRLPPLTLLNKNEQAREKIDQDVYVRTAHLLEEKLKNFGVSGNVIGISPGPVVTTYEYAPAPGIKINKIVGLSDDLALGLKARSVRVAGSVPGKSALGIEIPNEKRQIVYIRDILADESYRAATTAKLTVALGLDVVGNIALGNLAKMPHLLIAGATGAGKSIGINTIIASILYNATPDDVRFLMIDPKRIELSGYEGIPHLLHPVVVDPKLASRALNWAVREMERRYRMLEEARVKSFDSYNQQHDEKMPYIVVIVDELADLMMVASKDVETAIARLAQMARAAGMHLILATQRPSVDVLTGLIKANFPTRISFKVSSKIDSRTILDSMGAEHLLGMGDMLYLAPGSSVLQRIHGAFISEAETTRIVEFLQAQGQANYDPAMFESVENDSDLSDEDEIEEMDEHYDEALEFVSELEKVSISVLQRRLRVGYNRAARMIEVMEKNGIVGPADGAKPREVLVKKALMP